MTDLDVFRYDDGDDEEEEPQLFYGSSDEFMRERLRYIYARRVGPCKRHSAGLRVGGRTRKLSPGSMPSGAPGNTSDSTSSPAPASGGSNTPTTTCPYPSAQKDPSHGPRTGTGWVILCRTRPHRGLVPDMRH